jgi:hypothetical protein
MIVSMNRKSFGSLVVLLSLLAPAAMAQNTIRCESAYNRREECTFNGWGRVALSRQLSKTACIEGRTWGQSGRNGVWVSDGCRAEFVISRERDHNRRDDNGYGNRGEIITCRSNNGRFSRCAANTRFGVQMDRQISGASCVEGRTWGYDDDGIWVDRGCSAEFIIGTNNRGYHRNDRAYDRLIVCESVNNTRHNCSIDTRGGVQLSRQLSKNDCILNRTWGWDGRGIWVSNGCRGEFLVGR